MRNLNSILEEIKDIKEERAKDTVKSNENVNRKTSNKAKSTNKTTTKQPKLNLEEDIEYDYNELMQGEEVFFVQQLSADSGSGLINLNIVKGEDEKK